MACTMGCTSAFAESLVSLDFRNISRVLCFDSPAAWPASSTREHHNLRSVVDQLPQVNPQSSCGNLLDIIFSQKPQACQAHRGKYGLRGDHRADHFLFT
eukprot:1511828-Amphidinium_carterae.1